MDAGGNICVLPQCQQRICLLVAERRHRPPDHLGNGRALLLAIPDRRPPGGFIIGEGYWCTLPRAWWWANTATGLPGCDAITDVLDMTGGMWMPMVQPPMREAA